MRIILAAFLAGFNFSGHAQVLADCADCASRVVRSDELKELSIDEIRYLTNDLFARKGYVFQDSEIDAYYSQKSWYKPVNANYTLEYTQTEKKNIRMFQDRTAELKTERERMIAELKKFRAVCLGNNTQELNRLFHYDVAENSDFLKNILDEIILDDIHWYKNEGLYSVIRDNGEIVKSYALKISGRKIVFDFSIRGGSAIGNGETLYPKEHITELSYRYVFEFRNGRLIFIKMDEAG